MKVTHKK